MANIVALITTAIAALTAPHPKAPPPERKSVVSTSYCETGKMANGEHTYFGAVAMAGRIGSRWRVTHWPLRRRRFHRGGPLWTWHPIRHCPPRPVRPGPDLRPAKDRDRAGMSVEEHIWIRCDYPTCDARTPDHVDRMEARRWADNHGWAHQHPSRDHCPEHSGKELVPAVQPPQRPTGSMLEDGGGYWSEEGRRARLDTALDKIFQR